MKLNENNFPKFEINEQAGVMNMKFRVMTTGIPTGNQRIYKTPLMAKAVEAANARIEKLGPAYGSASHKPGLEVDHVSHLVQKFEMKGDELWAHVKILPTSSGRNLQAIISNGGKMGVSIRGKGSTKATGSGVDEVGDDYELEACDFVMDPACNEFVGKGNVFESLALSDDDHEIAHERYRQARAANFKGTFEEYLKIYAERKQLAEALVAEAEIAEPQTDDLEKALNESIQEKLGGHFYLMDYEDGVVGVFDLNKSEVSICDYSVNPDGTVAIDAGTKKVIDY
jgi:hypothetical protein